MAERYRVRVENNSLMFSAGHFITLNETECESLHGHDYRVAAEVAGPLGAQQFVVDFIAVEDLLRDLLGELDRGVLLPLRHPTIRVTSDDREVTVRFGQRRWVLPRSDCRLLDLTNTTTEMLAQFLGRRLLEALESRLGARPDMLCIEIAEGGGRSAAWQWSAEP